MFDREFYPTPKSVLEMMGIDCFDKVVLEPSAGKGDIVDYCKKWGARKVLAVEKVPELRKILSPKCEVIGSDFLLTNQEEVSHVELIVMNPPFSNAEQHIRHAWVIAPEGCEIIALCNWETLSNARGYGRSELYALVSDYGECRNLGNVFNNAERATNVEVGLVRLFKPLVSDHGKFEGFYMGDYEDEKQDNSLVTYDEIKAVVDTYQTALKVFDKVDKATKELNQCTNVEFLGKQLTDGTFEKHQLSYGCTISFGASKSDVSVSKDAFARGFQKKCWGYIFDRLDIRKYATSGVMSDINSFIESRKNYPFTVRNVYRMIEIIHGTRSQVMSKAIVTAVDEFTRYTHENRFGVEGWKTNSGYLLNKKIIVGNVAEANFRGSLRFKFGGRSVEAIIDLIKALCYLTGRNFNDLTSHYDFNYLTPNTWYDWGDLFDFKVFKKGTAHFKFKREKDWEILNREYAKAKGQVLPERL